MNTPSPRDLLSPRTATIRQSIVDHLSSGPPATARDISAAVGVPEKTVYDHLRHLQKSLRAQDLGLQVSPPACLDCGFRFRKRERLNRPGKCPVCRSTHLSEPRFTIG